MQTATTKLVLLLVAAGVTLACELAAQDNPEKAIEPGYWSRQAVALAYWQDAPFIEKAKDLTIPSPDKRKAVVVRPRSKDAGTDEVLPELYVVDDGTRIKPDIVPYFHPELLWSPDSNAVAVSSSSGSVLGEWRVLLYFVRREGFLPLDLTQQVRADLARRHPPCLGETATCNARKLAKDLSWVNVAAIRWLGDSSKILVVAQVPCSPAYG
ncbi:MAG: hypothetical protein JO187_03760, partial [Acidobacteria bacterium]|nr:hypothetical protein [Acidobacteriota bacterium]